MRPENTKDDYIAPIVGRYVKFMPYDKRADIYSLGMVLYYLSNDRHLPFSDIIDADERMQKRVFGTARLPEPCRAFALYCSRRYPILFRWTFF